MTFKIKPTRNKVSMSKKSLYISDKLVEKVEKMAADNDTSFNNVIVSIVEDFFDRVDNNEK